MRDLKPRRKELSAGPSGPPHDALTARVVLVDVNATGQSGFATPGLHAEASEIHATRCAFRGGDAGSAGQGNSAGGSGVWCNGTAWLNHCQIRGGNGHSSGGIGAYCGGGVIHIAGPSTTLIGGTGGLPAAASAVGNPGSVVIHAPIPNLSTSGNVSTGPRMPYLTVTGTALPTGVFSANHPVTIGYQGVIPNMPYFFVVGFAPDYSTAFGPLLLGPMLVDLNTATLNLGTLDSSGSFSGTFVPSTTIAALIGVPIFAQAGRHVRLVPVPRIEQHRHSIRFVDDGLDRC
ncbi:MAG: hypothetical protein ACJAUC_004276 [Planctomycetota bacterium]